MFIRILILALLIIAPSCGSSDLSYEKGAIKGTVTLNGEPLASGKIRFVPAVDTVGKITVAEIKDGQYEFDMERCPALGTHKIEIIATRKTGKKIPIPDEPEGTMRDETEQYLPASYNTNSRLTLEVKAGDNQGNFDLKIKK